MVDWMVDWMFDLSGMVDFVQVNLAGMIHLAGMVGIVD